MGYVLGIGIGMLAISVLFMILSIVSQNDYSLIMGFIFLGFSIICLPAGIIRESSLNKMTNPGIIISVDTEEFPNSKLECLKVEDGFIKFTNQKDTLVVTESYWKNNIIDGGKVVDNKNL